MEKFGFLIHPLDMRDVVRYEPKAAGKREVLVEKIFEWMPSHKESHITGLVSATGRQAEGWFITVPFMPRQFLAFNKDFVMGKITDGCRIVEKLGGKIVGLGGFTSVVGDAGISVSKIINIAVTSGNSYTIATAMEGAVEAASQMGISLESANAAVVGASGSIGSVCAQLLAKSVKSLTLVARNLPRLKKLAELIQSHSGTKVEVCTDISLGVRNADIIITATSSTGGIIKATDLKPGAVVCDVALPHDVCRDVATLRPDVLVIEGGLVEVPGDVNFNFDFGYPPKVALACMSETMILALEGRFENFSLGRGIKIEQVEEISRLAKTHGFKLAGFRSFDSMVTPEQIHEIRSLARKKQKGFKVFTGGV